MDGYGRVMDVVGSIRSRDGEIGEIGETVRDATRAAFLCIPSREAEKLRRAKLCAL